jgi:hypothetical protein
MPRQRTPHAIKHLLGKTLTSKHALPLHGLKGILDLPYQAFLDKPSIARSLLASWPLQFT